MTQSMIPLFSGRYEKGSGLYGFARYAGWDAFIKAKQDAEAQGLRLCALNIQKDAQTAWFTGVWIESSDNFDYYAAQNWNSFYDHFTQNQTAGLGLVDFNFAEVDGNLLYTGIYLGNRGSQKLIHDRTFAQLLSDLSHAHADEMQLVKVQCRADGSGAMLYTGLFQPGPTNDNGPYAGSWPAVHNYITNDPNRDNVNCLQVLDYGPQGAQHAVAVYLPSIKPHLYVLAADWDYFVGRWKVLSGQDYRLQSIEVQQEPNNWDSAFGQVFGARAVGYSFGAKVDTLPAEIGAHGYAIADGAQLPITPMTETTPLTLGSVSKLIEAIAMLYLIQETNSPDLTLQTPFFSLIDGHYGISPSDVKDARVKAITILDLLTHTSSLDDPWGDQNTNQTLWDYIKRCVGQTPNPLKVGDKGEAGVVYCYSSAGFQTIRGVVQAVTGANTYQEWVTANIFSKLGMNSTYIPDPNTTYNLRYYNRDLKLTPPPPKHPDYPPGIIHAEASWNSTPGDMIKLLSALRSTSPLNPQTMTQMLHAWPLRYQFVEGPPSQRVDYNGQIRLGFDATGTPAPNYLAKNGMYTNYSQAAIVRFMSRPIDVVVQVNTDTATDPKTGKGDSNSVWPEDVILNMFYRMYYY
jgi:CubicO group peptidase (beta-lactamase class C family)